MDNEKLQRSIDYFDSDYTFNIADETRKHLGIIILALKDTQVKNRRLQVMCGDLIKEDVETRETVGRKITQPQIDELLIIIEYLANLPTELNGARDAGRLACEGVAILRSLEEIWAEERSIIDELSKLTGKYYAE